jgi:energy-coupling factor transporter transmembrane protein EcfT
VGRPPTGGRRARRADGGGALSRPVRATRPHLGPLLVGAMLGALVAGRSETALLCVVVALMAARAAGAPPPGRRWLLTLSAGAIVAWALNLYLTPGRPLTGGWPVLGGRHASAEGLAMGWLLTLRFAGACAALQGLRVALPGEHAADAAARWLAPLERLRLPVSEARAMLGLALRFAPLLAAETARIAQVQELRAGRRPRGLREWLQRRRAGTVPTMVGALERAERVALALDARHYRLRPPPARLPAAATPAAVRSAGVVAATGLVALALLWRA